MNCLMSTIEFITDYTHIHKLVPIQSKVQYQGQDLQSRCALLSLQQAHNQGSTCTELKCQAQMEQGCQL